MLQKNKIWKNRQGTALPKILIANPYNHFQHRFSRFLHSLCHWLIISRFFFRYFLLYALLCSCASGVMPDNPQSLQLLFFVFIITQNKASAVPFFIHYWYALNMFGKVNQKKHYKIYLIFKNTQYQLWYWVPFLSKSIKNQNWGIYWGKMPFRISKNRINTGFPDTLSLYL